MLPIMPVTNGNQYKKENGFLYVCVAFKLSNASLHKRESNFDTNLIKILNYYNIPFNISCDNLDDTKIMHFVNHMQKKYITYWKHSVCNSQKLEFYNVFKDSYTSSSSSSSSCLFPFEGNRALNTPSIYLDVIRNKPNRKTLVKFRISNPKLNIETGRYDKISRCDRICPVCSISIEDEIHFLFCLIAQNIHQFETTF